MIEEIHPQRRDRALVDYPSFRTGVQYESGMSGGPIISESGYVIGIVSASVDTGGSGSRDLRTEHMLRR